MIKPQIIPSVFATEIGSFNKRLVLASEMSDNVHVDLMDGNFVAGKSPDLTKMSNFDGAEVHLMVNHPKEYFDKCVKKGASKFIVHIESVKDIVEFVKLKLSLPKGIGLFAAIKPETNISKLADFIEDADGFLLMGVSPGRENQKLIESTNKRIKELRKLTLKPIEIDGGVRLDNAQKLVKSGANMLVSGSEIFNSKLPEKTFVELDKLINR